MKRTIFLFLILLICFTVSVNAALVDNGDGTITQTRNDGSTLMWLKDADTNGFMTWTEANTWIETLNSSNYLGYNNWRLPDTGPVNGSSFNYNFSYDGSTDLAYNIGAPGTAYEGSTGSEMAYMFYTEFGNLAAYDISGNFQPHWSDNNNTGPFDNLSEVGYYWSGTLYNSDSDYAWGFTFDSGDQGPIYTYAAPDFARAGAWAVRDLSVVPEPISSVLFITGGALLAVRRYTKKTNP